MENEKIEFENILLEDSKSSKIKKIILAAVVFLLLLIIIILTTRLFLQDDRQTESGIIIPPEPAAVAKPDAKANEPLFEQVPIDDLSQKSGPVDEVIEKLKKTGVPPKEASKPTVVAQPEPVPVQPVKAAEPAPKPAAATPMLPDSESYYLQVGAFFKYPPNQKFLKAIDDAGYRYTIAEGTRNGQPYKKVLVGPYADKAQAKAALVDVKRRINQGAYVTKGLQ